MFLTAYSNESPDHKDSSKYKKWSASLAEKDLFCGRTVLKYKEELGLSREQIKKIENLMLAHEEQSIRAGAEVKIGGLRFATYVKSEKVDRKEIEKLIRELSQKKTACMIEYMNYLLDVRETLTEEQLRKIKSLREKYRREKTGEKK